MKNILNYDINDYGFGVPASSLRAWIKKNQKDISALLLWETCHYLKEKNLTQEKAADDLGVSRVYLNNVLNGYRRISPDLLMRLAKYINKDWRYLIGLISDKNKEYDNAPITTENAAKLFLSSLGFEYLEDDSGLFRDRWGNEYPASKEKLDLLYERMERATRFFIEELFFD